MMKTTAANLMRFRMYIFLAALVLVAGRVAGVPAYADGASFVVIAAGMQGAARTVATWNTTAVTVMPLAQIPWRSGTLKSRAYQPARAGGRGIVLVPGVHPSGIDEPRLVGFAREIAAMGHPVLTVELPDLARYSITTRTTDMIEDAVAWSLRQPEYAGRDGRVGLLGISFGGGLSIVAAGRPSIRDRVGFVMAFGGHGDLPRTLRYLCTGVQPDGAVRPPHDYGLAIGLLGAADRVVPAAQVQPLRDAILSYLEASRLAMVDQRQAAEELERAKRLESTLEPPSHTYMQFVIARDVAKLGPVLLPYIDDLGGDPALSPARSPLPKGPVYLLHGTDDNVVPSIESTLLGRELESRGITTHVLLTPLITHAEVDRGSTMTAIWRLIDFWSGVLHE